MTFNQIVEQNGPWDWIKALKIDYKNNKIMKPKVQWRCLKTDVPEPTKRYWFASRDGGTVEALWVNRDGVAPTGNSDTVSGLLRLQWTHWAPYEAPEPPPKPTPFEVWWNSLPAAIVSGRNTVVAGIELPNGSTTVANVETARQIWAIAWEVCEKNMAGGAK